MTNDKQKPLFSPSRLLFFVLSLVIFYFVVRHLGQLNQIKNLLLGIKPWWLLLALGTQIMTYAFNAFILQVLLVGKTGIAGFISLFKISVVIMFVNQLLPTGGISGNGYVFNELVKRKISPPKAFNALILETLCYYIAFLLLLGSFYGWYRHYSANVTPEINYAVLTGFIFFSALGAVILIVSNPKTLAFLMPKLSRFKFIKRYIEKMDLQLLHQETGKRNILLRDKTATLNGILLQIGILLLDTITVYALIKGLGVELPFSLIVFGFMLTLVIGSLPTSPGALIAYEGAMTYFFHTLGLPLQTALVVTLLFRFFTFWLPIPIGLILFRNLQKR